ncbi:MAG TPA: UbiA family prenyltransferase [Candidatus Acidoferrales bacterium]|nr:UbiA family prenyltransferase [Candidatus Acidoferrales bacterium]
MASGKLAGAVTLLFREVFIGMILVVVLPTALLGVIASGHINVLNIVGALVLMSLMQFAPNALNNYVDWDIDEANDKRMTMHKALSKRKLLEITLVLLLLTIPFFVFGNLYLRIAMLIGYFLIFNYNVLLRAKDKIFLNYAFIALFYGSLAFTLGFFFASGNLQLFLSIIWIPIFLFFIDLGFSVNKDYEDVDGDAKHGKKTVPVVLGKNMSLVYQFVIITAIFIWVFYISATQIGTVFLGIMIAFYAAALYCLNKVRMSNFKSVYHDAHNIIRVDALLIRVSLMALFLILGYHAVISV